MNKRAIVWVFISLMAATVLAGCRSAPVQNIENAAVTTTADEEITREDVRDAIIQAGSQLGWRMQEKDAGHLIGTLNIRSHQAKVDIRYDTSSYDITYRDSSNLDYDGEKIHSNYNDWVRNLDRTIQNQLVAL